MAYHLEGKLLEVCDCRTLCPCWIGEDPDNGTCKGFLCYQFERGTIEGIDVSGRALAMMADIPGNILNGNMRAAVYLDDQTTTRQQDALVSAFTGKCGGPLAELAKLIGEVVSVERVPIEFDVHEGKGRLRIGSVGYAELEPYRNAAGRITTLRDTVISTVPGAPVFVGKAPVFRAKHDKLGIDLDLSGHNALQSTFLFEG
ncbi:MAG TPA: DUF1326 domain-containing protein [Casimicrobiaceae bacterium]|jgi:hypothetical protein